MFLLVPGEDDVPEKLRTYDSGGAVRELQSKDLKKTIPSTVFDRGFPVGLG